MGVRPLSYVETISDATEFDAPASAVWALLIDWAAILDWMPGGYIQSLEMEGRGVGATRHLLTLNGPRLSERLDAADEASGTLELCMLAPLPWGLESYKAHGKLESLSSCRCRLTWTGTLEMPSRDEEFGRTSRILRKSYAMMFLGIRQQVES